MPSSSILFDVTRLIATGWAGRQPTGIDRVCDAYLAHYRDRTQAVIQHRGVFRVLSKQSSNDLFDLLADRDEQFRKRLMRIAPTSLADSAPGIEGAGQIYLNVGHTDFDLASHHRWVERCGLKAVYLIHDLIPLEFSSYCREHAVRRHTGRVLNALHRAAGIIVNSQATGRDLQRFAESQDVSLPPVLPAHLGVDETIDPGIAPNDTERHFVCVGTIEPRKNHLMLLKVWQRLIERGEVDLPRLVLIGQWGAMSKPVRSMIRSDPRLARSVTVLDHCTDAEMARWVSSAEAVLLPTLAEGFGLPLAEALALGTPVIASDLPCFREIGHGIPLLVPPTDEAAWEAEIAAFLRGNSEARRQLMLMCGYRPPRWVDHFAAVDHWLDEIAYAPDDDKGCATSKQLLPLYLASAHAGAHSVPSRVALKKASQG